MVNYAEGGGKGREEREGAIEVSSERRRRREQGREGAETRTDLEDGGSRHEEGDSSSDGDSPSKEGWCPLHHLPVRASRSAGSARLPFRSLLPLARRWGLGTKLEGMRTYSALYICHPKRGERREGGRRRSASRISRSTSSSVFLLPLLPSSSPRTAQTSENVRDGSKTDRGFGEDDSGRHLVRLKDRGREKRREEREGRGWGELDGRAYQRDGVGKEQTKSPD